MSFNESRERDHALRIAAAGNTFTPTDAVRDLTRVLDHMTDVARDKSYDAHIEQGCAVCLRATVWQPVINGMLA